VVPCLCCVYNCCRCRILFVFCVAYFWVYVGGGVEGGPVVMFFVYIVRHVVSDVLLLVVFEFLSVDVVRLSLVCIQ